MKIKSSMEYKESFIMVTIGSFVSTFLAFVGVWLLIDKFNVIDKWDINVITLTSGIAMFCHAITEMFGRGFDHFYKLIRQGDFDRIIVRPRSILIQVASSNFEVTKIGRVLLSIILLIIGISNINVDWNISKIIILLAMIFGSIIIFTGIIIIKAAFSFWTIEGIEIMNILSDGGRKLSQYPINIYDKWFNFIFTFIIPFGLINYFPLVYLLDKTNTTPVIYAITPFFTLLFILPCLLFWKNGLKRYASTGS
jgi:ABC-2 type transport system permease protein